MQLVIGNKNYSSWSLRPWILMRALGIPFTERHIRLDASDFDTQLATVYDGSTVPVLIDGDKVIWESLAIIEYLAERFSALGVWPQGADARALARSMSAEMHAGFTALRSACPMNLGKRYAARDRGIDCAADVARICLLWRKARETYGRHSGEPYLFGTFSAADAMYAPVVTRLDTYAIEVPADARAYMDAILGSAAFSEWRAAALLEPWVFEEDEIDEVAISDLRNTSPH
jgi:glutathione S-transferase